MKKVHIYVNPRNGAEVCARQVEPDERYRWNLYQRANRKLVDCRWCRRIAGLRVKKVRT